MGDLTSSQVSSLVLLDGKSRPATLLEVLECAQACSSTQVKQLVIELKQEGDWEGCAKAVCVFLESRPDLLPYVSVVMSFSLSMMKIVAQVRRRTVYAPVKPV